MQKEIVVGEKPRLAGHTPLVVNLVLELWICPGLRMSGSSARNSLPVFSLASRGSSRNKGGVRLNSIEYKNIPTPIDHINKLITCEEQSHGT